MPDMLLQQRQFDALRSGGVSNDRIHDAILRYIEARSLRGAVLDFGAGRGSLTRKLLALDRFTTVSAADILERPELPTAVRWITSDLNERLSLPDGSFDVIVMSEVIEHLENPRAIFREAYRLLTDGGVLVLTTPNNESWRSIISLLVRGHFAGFIGAAYPAHKTALLRSDLQRAAAEAGFGSSWIAFTDFGGIPSLPHISWQRVSFGLLRGLRFSDNVLIAVSK